MDERHTGVGAVIPRFRIRPPKTDVAGHMSATHSLAARGYCVVPVAPAADHAAAMLAEATSLAPSTRRVSGDYYRVNGDRSVSSPRCLGTVAAGAVLDAVHRDNARLELLERIAGRPLTPTRGCYIYYEPGDFIGLHKDAAVCEVTLITSISGALDPLVIHPSLIGVPPEELVAISRAYSSMPPGGTGVTVPSGGSFLMLMGSTVPHHRPAALHPCTIATLCYV